MLFMLKKQITVSLLMGTSSLIKCNPGFEVLIWLWEWLRLFMMSIITSDEDEFADGWCYTCIKTHKDPTDSGCFQQISSKY